MTYYESTHTGLPDPELDSQFYENVTARRLVAWVFDVVFAFGITTLIGMFTLGIAFFVFPLIWLAVGFLYRTLTLASKSSTWGMRIVGIEVRNRQGHKLDLGTAVFHTLIYSVAIGSFILQIISIVMILSSRYGQGLQDMLLGTAVINRPAK